MQITIGSNDIREYSIVEDDGTTPVDITTLSRLQLEILNYKSVRAIYVLNTDSQVRIGSTNDKLEVEIPVAISSKFREGDIIGRLTMEKVDADYTQDTHDIKVSSFLLYEATTIQTDFDSGGTVSGSSYKGDWANTTAFPTSPNIGDRWRVWPGPLIVGSNVYAGGTIIEAGTSGWNVYSMISI